MYRKKIPLIHENWLDKAYRYVAPIKAADRLKARMTLALAGKLIYTACLINNKIEL